MGDTELFIADCIYTTKVEALAKLQAINDSQIGWSQLCTYIRAEIAHSLGFVCISDEVVIRVKDSVPPACHLLAEQSIGDTLQIFARFPYALSWNRIVEHQEGVG